MSSLSLSASPSSGAATSPSGPSASTVKIIQTSKSKTGSTRKVSSPASKVSKRLTNTRLTPSMQDAQARGRDPYAVTEQEDSDGGVEDFDLNDRKAYRTNYEKQLKMKGAAAILDNPEVLMMKSLQRGDSIPNTRNFYAKMMCGYSDPNDNDTKIMDKLVGSAGREKRVTKPQGSRFDRQGRELDTEWDM